MIAMLKSVIDSETGQPVTVEISSDEAATIPPPPVVTSVTRRQARQALYAAGLLTAVDSYFAAQPAATRIDYEDAQTFDRGWPTLALAAAELGLTSEQIDALFIDAATR